MHPSSSIRPLAPSLSVHEIADECRDVAVAFLNGAHSGWGKRELAAWLIGPYARATSYVRRGTVEPSFDGGSDIERAVSPTALARVMDDARSEVIATIGSLTVPEEGVAFAFAAISRALVVRCADELGDLGWAPFPPQRLRLADRLLSLVAVDYLARPLDYEQAFAVCERCGVVAFDTTARSRGLCRRHLDSGVKWKEADTAPFDLVPQRSA